MRRTGNLIEQIADADNLRLAFWKASIGKRGKREVLSFRGDLDGNLRRLREDLLSGSVTWGPYHEFHVFSRIKSGFPDVRAIDFGASFASSTGTTTAACGVRKQRRDMWSRCWRSCVAPNHWRIGNVL